MYWNCVKDRICLINEFTSWNDFLGLRGQRWMSAEVWTIHIQSIMCVVAENELTPPPPQPWACTAARP